MRARGSNFRERLGEFCERLGEFRERLGNFREHKVANERKVSPKSHGEVLHIIDNALLYYPFIAVFVTDKQFLGNVDGYDGQALCEYGEAYRHRQSSRFVSSLQTARTTLGKFIEAKFKTIPKDKESLVLSRDLLLFSCYTGAAYVDAVSVTRDNLVTDEEGSLWLKYYRHKTKALAQVKLLPEAVDLIEK